METKKTAGHHSCLFGGRTSGEHEKFFEYLNIFKCCNAGGHFTEDSKERFRAGEPGDNPASGFEVHLTPVHIGDFFDLIRKIRQKLVFEQGLLNFFFLFMGKGKVSFFHLIYAVSVGYFLINFG